MQSMKVCTTGLIVRFFNVTIATGQLRWEKSTGNMLSERCSAGEKRNTDPDSSPIKRPVLSNRRRWYTEYDVTPNFGTAKPSD
jgi:hypothetical protein